MAAPWIVDALPPRMLAVQHLGDHEPCDGAVGEAMARVAGADVDMFQIGRAANVREAIARLDDLPRPPGDDVAHDGQPLARPALELDELRPRILLPHPVIFTADDEHVLSGGITG